MKRTAEMIEGSGGYHSVVRFTDCDPSAVYPSSELLGYYHSSALRTDKPTFCAKPFLLLQLEGLRTYGSEECPATKNRKGQEKIS